jgi:hypothetical protein
MSKKPDSASRMAEILNPKRLAELRGQDAPPSPAPAEPLPSRPERSNAKAPAEPEAIPDERSKPAGRGRPLGSKNAKAGKKSDEEYCPTTVYIRKETRKRVKQTLLDAESAEDVSDLVESLLQEWLEKQG